MNFPAEGWGGREETECTDAPPWTENGEREREREGERESERAAALSRAERNYGEALGWPLTGITG